MSKLPVVISLSLSLLAAGMAWVALGERGTEVGGGQHSAVDAESLSAVDLKMRRLTSEVKTLGLRLEKFEGIAAVTAKKAEKGETQPGASDPGFAADLAALAERLESLESDENIAELARSGFARAREKEAEDALSLVLDTSRPAGERLRAWQGLRKGGGKKGQSGPPEALQSIIDLARDTTLGPELREEAVKSLRGERSEEVKEPMLNILAEDDDPQVRRRSLEVLMWHGGDPAVLETITAISREDRHEGVQQHAEAILPKVQHFSREAAAQSERGGGSK
jgi:HEAT repeat protein